jgi:hypothetical protein
MGPTGVMGEGIAGGHDGPPPWDAAKTSPHTPYSGSDEQLKQGGRSPLDQQFGCLRRTAWYFDLPQPLELGRIA